MEIFLCLMDFKYQTKSEAAEKTKNFKKKSWTQHTLSLKFKYVAEHISRCYYCEKGHTHNMKLSFEKKKTTQK